MTPDDRRYTKTHEWIKLEGNEVVIGISDHAQEALGDITFVELPAVGSTFAGGDEFGVIESVKAASDLYTPLAGEVVAINEALENSPEQINQDPYGGGWMIRLANVDAGEFKSLMDADDYEGLLED
ncbi:MAG: glycine cleavage system protein GcvH [Verrucomicrobia bacterium]|nr:glycine cleavage system protein GcvH [Verrucomicrobiota bacterium]